MRRVASTAVAVVLLAAMLTGCGGKDLDDPRQVVISLFGAMERNDQSALIGILDMAELMKTRNEDYAVQTSNPRSFTSPDQILKDLTEDGKTKQLWFKHQRIVNTAEIMDDVAMVEVTFVDKEASRGYRTKFGLHKINGKWRIYSFKTVQDSDG
ncbi:MAG: hypothetical protein KKA42_02845 [candidate division Zixibacteria bacterium]|nr:hypothetical protein [candidate division Zixibacteria bacterium]